MKRIGRPTLSLSRASLALSLVFFSASIAGCGMIIGLSGDYKDRSNSISAGGGSSGGGGSRGGAAGANASHGGGGAGGVGGGCPKSATCKPSETASCGNCGTKTCDPVTCTFGACEGEGCAPGTVEPCPGNDSCGERICSNLCTWCGCTQAIDCASCDPNFDDVWLGCGTSGCSVCPSRIDGYPCYLQNHPGCFADVSCDQETICSYACPRPTSDDACSCDASHKGWHGCEDSGCKVCGGALSGFECYEFNHPNCTIDTSCTGTNGKCSDSCPAPSDADRGTPN